MSNKRLLTWAVILFFLIPLMGLIHRQDTVFDLPGRTDCQVDLYNSGDPFGIGSPVHLGQCVSDNAIAYGWPDKAIALEPQHYSGGPAGPLIPEPGHWQKIYPNGIAVDMGFGLLAAMPFVIRILMNKSKNKNK